MCSKQYCHFHAIEPQQENYSQDTIDKSIFHECNNEEVFPDLLDRQELSQILF